MRSNKLFWLTLTIAALLLSACGGAPAEAPTAQTAPTAPAAQATTASAPTTAAAQPTPAFESVTDTEPTIGAAPAVGALAWRDQVLRNDAIFVSASGLPAPEAGQVYSAWLSNKDGSLALGPLQASAGGLLALNFTSPTQENLLGTYDQLYITKGAPSDTNAKNAVLSGGLPNNALVHIRHVLFSIGNTPGKIGFALGLRQESDELLRHAQFLKDAFDQGNFALEKVHAEHIVNIIEGSQGEHFGDLNGDGKVQNPGDGFGILQNGQQDGYVKGMSDHAKLAADATDATDAIKLHAGHVQIAGENTRVRVTDIRDRALNISKAGGIADTQQDVLNILSLAQQAIQGVDINQDEQVGPIPGEGGVLTAYQHAQLMAGIALAPAAAATAPPAAQPAPAAAQTFTIEIGDNTFTPNKLTIPVGATVVWNDKGQHPHTVTADDGSFDSQELQNGATFKQTFEQAGEFPFFCKFHGGKGGEGMAGSIIVTAQSSAAAPAAAAPTAAPAQPQPPAAGATTVQVAIGDNTFTPKQISVPVGATVVWTHGGQRQHTVTADDNSFKSDTLKNGDTFKQTFDKPGTYAYYCEFHGGPGGGGMSGVITVGGGGGPPAAPTPAPVAQPTAAPPPAAPAAATVSMKDFEFGPKEIHVKAGTTITWKNEGTKPHSATAVDKSFDTAIFQPGESKSATFSTPGTFAYFCQLHGSPDGKNGMVATVIVDP